MLSRLVAAAESESSALSAERSSGMATSVSNASCNSSASQTSGHASVRTCSIAPASRPPTSSRTEGGSVRRISTARARRSSRSVIEIGVRRGIQNLMRKHRGNRRIDCKQTNRSVVHAANHVFEALDIHRFGENVLHHFANQRMIGNLDITFDVLLARSYIGEDCREKIVGTNPQNRWRNFLPVSVPKQRKRSSRIPAPARLENRRGKRRLFQNLLHVLFAQKLEYVGEGKAVLFSESDVQAVFGRGSLQFEIEGTAEAFSQRQPPSFINPRSERGVDHKLHTSAFIEEPFGDEGGLRGNCAENGPAGDDVLNNLFGAGIVHVAFVLQPLDGRCHFGNMTRDADRRNVRRKLIDFGANERNLMGKLGGSGRSLAAPERNRRSRALCVFDQHTSA